MNLPTDRTHDPLSGYGRLIMPWFGVDLYGNRRWLAVFDNYGVRKTDINGFHNCRKTGIY